MSTEAKITLTQLRSAYYAKRAEVLQHARNTVAAMPSDIREAFRMHIMQAMGGDYMARWLMAETMKMSQEDQDAFDAAIPMADSELTGGLAKWLHLAEAGPLSVVYSLGTSAEEI